MDAVNDVVGPYSPIRGRPDSICVPRGSGQPRPIARQPSQCELPLIRDEISLQVRRFDVLVRRQLLHRRWILRYREAKQSGFIPDLNRFHERTG